MSWTTNGDGPAYSVNGSSGGSNGSSYTEGHIWERTASSVGAVYVDSDTGVAYQASSTAWRPCLASGRSSEKAGLAFAGVSSRAAAATGLDLSAYTIDNATMALLWTWDGPMPGAAFSVIGVIGASAGTSGIQIVAATSGGDTQLLAVTGSGAATTVLHTYSPASSFVGLHALAIAPVNVGGTHKWRFSLDGSAVVDVTMTANYVAPTSSAEFGFGSRSTSSSPVAGAMHEVSVWGSLLSNANLLALATLPGTATYRLPISSATGHPTLRAEACRWDEPSRGPVPVYGLGAALTVSGAVAKTTY